MDGAKKNNKKECLHCKSEFYGAGDYCCSGCETANKLISGLGLKNFYKYLENQISRTNLKLNDNSVIEEVDMTEFVIKEDDGTYTLNLLVEGLHCSSCVWLIEEALKKQENITHARLNMSTRRLVIKWQGGKKLGSEYTNLIRKMGYKATPFDPETMKTEESKEQRNMLLAMAVAGFASGNIMLLSVALWSTTQEIMGVATRDFIHLISAMIAIPTVVFSGRVFFKSAIVALSNRKTNMDVPISLAIILTTLVSIWEWFDSAEHTYFDSVTMLVFFLLIGRYLDVKSKNKARSAASEMLRLMANSANIIMSDGSLKTIPASKIQIGDIIQVNTGDKFPIDGVIIEGETEIDTSIITGESVPKLHKKDDEVFAGTINLGQTIRIKATKPSEKSLISEVIKLMEKAEDSSTKYNSISDKAVKIYAPLVYFAGLGTFLFWHFYNGAEFKDSLIIGISVLIITCPCAFGLAVPTVQVLASSRLFKNGIMLKNGNALEELSKVTLAVFDKTGTLTLGKPKLINKEDIPQEHLKIAASLAAKSNHPYSKAIVNEYSGKLIDLEVSELSGKGLEAEYQGKTYKLGKPDWVIGKEGEGIILSENGKELASFKFSDEIRGNASEIIKELKERNITPSLVSGDNQQEVRRIANLVSIENYRYSVMPNEKVSEVENLKKGGNSVLMVGDGLNDAPALAHADVSISPSNAIHITQNSADIVFQGERLSPIITCIDTARKSISVIKQNFGIAFVYNLIAIPIAFLGYVTPLVAAAAMSFSSILVVLNSFRVGAKY
jgi:Cu2+-exporting ATPase